MLRTFSPIHPLFEKKSTLFETDEKGALSLGERAPFSSVLSLGESESTNVDSTNVFLYKKSINLPICNPQSTYSNPG
jgi:hypothetical protein